MAHFTTTETQPLKITFQVNEQIDFPGEYEDADRFATMLVESVIENCDGDIGDYEITEMDFDEDSLGLAPGESYCIEVSCTVGISGTCDYDPGRSYGDPYYCYPESIDDVEYEEGMVVVCLTDNVKAVFPELADLNVEIGEVSADGDIELDDTYYPEDEPGYEDRYDSRYDDWDD